MEIIFNIALKSMSRSVHHKVAVEALRLIPDEWRKLFLKNINIYLKGSKAPDKEFHDFMNHVYHVHQDWGGAPKSAQEWYNKLVELLQNKKWTEAVYAAGVLSHYYADVSHPFHTGQTEAEARIHSYTEFGAAEIYQKKIHPFLKLELSQNITNDVTEFTKNMAKESFEYYVDFLDEFDTSKASKNKWGKAYSQRLIDITIDLLSHAISGYASLLNKAINEAGVSPPRTNLALQSFINILNIPIYWILRKMDKNEKKKITRAIEKEVKETGKAFHSLSEDDRTIVTEYSKAKKTNSTWIDHPKLNKQRQARTEKKTVKMSKKGSNTTTKKESKTNKQEKTTKNKKKQVTNEKVLRYYLNLTDNIEKAPEIGKKTAERLMKIGINTVQDLIQADAQQVAKKLNHPNIKAKDIERWKIEAELNSSIAGTRGHDVRIMYEMGIRKPEDLQAIQSEKLLKQAKEIAVKLGERVVSKSSMPTLKEVEKWKNNAEKARQMK